MSFLSDLFGRRAAVVPVRLAGDGACDFEVVGEHAYQAALSEICGGKCETGTELECVAQLVPEPSNPYDGNAIAVRVRGKTVAYLRREDAKEYHAHMGRQNLRGRITECDAFIVGGWSRLRRDGERSEGDFGIKLDLVWPPIAEN